MAEGIVRLFLERNEQAIEECRTRYSRYLREIALRILGNREDAEECESDTYLDAWNSIPPNEPEDLKTYLGKLARRNSIDRLRRENAVKRGGSEYALSLDELAECVTDDEDPTASEVDGRELERMIDGFLRTLPDTERRIFLRRYWFADPIAEIAERFGYKEVRVRTQLFRTREKLKQFLLQEGVHL